jgi:hypothetical protein
LGRGAAGAASGTKGAEASVAGDGAASGTKGAEASVAGDGAAAGIKGAEASVLGDGAAAGATKAYSGEAVAPRAATLDAKAESIAPAWAASRAKITG